MLACFIGYSGLASAEAMHRGRIPDSLSESRYHDLGDPRIERRRSVVVEIYFSHDAPIIVIEAITLPASPTPRLWNPSATYRLMGNYPGG